MECISSFVTFLASVVLGFMARRSPKRDWEFIKSWPGFVLLVISLATSQVEFAASEVQRQLGPPPKFVCAWVTDDSGMPVQKCDYVYQKPVPQPPSLAPLLRWLLNLFVSPLLDLPFEFAGIFLGRLVAGRQEAVPKPA